MKSYKFLDVCGIDSSYADNYPKWQQHLPPHMLFLQCNLISSIKERVPCSQPLESQWVCGDFDRIKVPQKWHYVTSEFRSPMVIQTLLGSPLVGSQLPPKQPTYSENIVKRTHDHEPNWAPSQQPESARISCQSWVINLGQPTLSNLPKTEAQLTSDHNKRRPHRRTVQMSPSPKSWLLKLPTKWKGCFK